MTTLILPHRRLVRAELAIRLEPYVRDVASEVFDHQPSSVDGTPIVMVLSSGSDRLRTSRNATRASLFYEIHNAVLYEDAGLGWTRQNAEDALDNLEYDVARFVFGDDHSSENWKDIVYAGRSFIDRVNIGGKEHQDEIIMIQVEVF